MAKTKKALKRKKKVLLEPAPDPDEILRRLNNQSILLSEFQTILNRVNKAGLLDDEALRRLDAIVANFFFGLTNFRDICQTIVDESDYPSRAIDLKVLQDRKIPNGTFRS